MSQTVEPPSLPPAFTHQQILRVIAGILLCILLAAIDQTVVVPAVPAMAADLQGFNHLSWIVSAYLLTSTAATPIYGRLSDMYGRRALLLPALVWFAITSVLCGFAQTLPQLIVFRGLQGIGGAGLMAMAQAAIADVVSPRERGRYQGYMASVWGLASIAGPVVGGYLTDHLSWRWIFWINLPISIVAIFLCNRGLKLLTPRNVRAKIDYWGAAMLTAGVASWLVVLSSGGVDFGWLSWPSLVLTFGGMAVILLLARHERHVDEPLLPPRIFVNPIILSGVTIAFFASLALFAAIFLLPLYFQLVLGVDASTSGVLLMPYLAVNVVGAMSAGQLARRMGKVRAIVIGGLSMCVVGFLLLSRVTAHTPQMLLIPAQMIVGAGIGSLMPSTLVMVQNAAERRDVGVVTGCLLFLRSMGGAFGSAVAGALLSNRFASTVRSLNLDIPIDLGELRGAASATATLPPQAREQIQAALTGGFSTAFLACGAALAVALVVAIFMRDVPLRSTTNSEPEPLGH